ncbi:MAG TPA: M23 family metallopeptidase [Candidatus Limnocylindrales bacterium]|nr:M23 family metallopeptidase [Candidatus Limnocylindrales bacterium]
MRNATVGVQRVIARLRTDSGRRAATAKTFQRRSISLAHAVRAGAKAGSRPSGERLVPMTAVALVAIAVTLSNIGTVANGATRPTGPTGNTSGAGSEPRIALGGAVSGIQGRPADDFGDAVAPEGNVGLDGGDLSDGGPSLAPDDRVTIDGPFSADGTLLKPVSVDTTVADGAELIRSYRVKSGDTLTGIASKFHVSMMTVWWANDLKNKDDLHIGQTLTIPPVSGVVVTVSTSDTLETLAAKYHSDAADIMDVNQLADPNLVVGQTLTIPGARSKPIPTPKPTATPRPHSSGSSSGGSTRPPAQYSGGKLSWPVSGGYISQYFHYGHYAIDIAADMGTRVSAAAGGTVIFAGWKNNGGGYQVWIAHGSGLYTTYNHMSSISVGRGQHVSRGQQVGRVGMTGNATGPHLHFEVWRGPVWDGGTRVNPLIYL